MKAILAALALVLALVATGCSSGTTTSEAPTTTAAAPPRSYVAVGASESVGIGADAPLRDAWTKQFWLSLPRNYTFQNVAVAGATTQDALDRQLPAALALNPDVVTMWLNVNDILTEVSAADYERQLSSLVGGLRNGSQRRILIATTPPLTALPRLSGESALQLNAAVTAYNAAIRRVAATNNAIVVDLGAAEAGVTNPATLIANDGFHPSTAGHRVVAEAFTRANQTAGPLP